MAPHQDIISALSPHRPLLLVDADEVLLKFLEHMETFLNSQNYELRLTSFRLTGNIFTRGTDEAAEHSEVRNLIARFFDDCVDDIPPVEGAAEALQALSNQYQIIVLTNVPEHCRERRQKNLANHGIDYPLIANAGEKGPMVKRLTENLAGPSVFVDDLAFHHRSVASHAPDTHRVHFVADTRLTQLVDKADEAHVRIDLWPELRDYLLQEI